MRAHSGKTPTPPGTSAFSLQEIDLGFLGIEAIRQIPLFCAEDQRQASVSNFGEPPSRPQNSDPSRGGLTADPMAGLSPFKNNQRPARTVSLSFRSR